MTGFERDPKEIRIEIQSKPSLVKKILQKVSIAINLWALVRFILLASFRCTAAAAVAFAAFRFSVDSQTEPFGDHGDTFVGRFTHRRQDVRRR